MIRHIPTTFLISLLASATYISAIAADEPAAPPTMGQETKGVPALPETRPDLQGEDDPLSDSGTLSALGTTRVTESKRENGQVYRIEVEHSLGGTQYIEELDSDGVIESTNNDIEQTPNLPKWKLGSW
ncbi:MAG: DUF2782 domain-containing protein [Arenicella sp.]|nr:DUF2782 domain-containing protein [Arenicella sp.]